MDYSTVFGIILIAGGGIAFACGTYATNGILNTRVKRSLAVICFAIVFWSLGLAISAVASNKSISEVGHLFAPIGWGPMSGLLLHFTLLITEKEKLLKKWWIYPILYLPGLALLVGFTVLPLLGYFTDSFVHTAYGWVPILNHDFFDFLYYAYFGGYIVINLIILLIDRKNAQDKARKAQSTLLAITYTIAYILGTVSDIVFGYLDILVPRHAAIYSLIPLAAMTYLVKNYGTIDLETNSNNNDEVHSNIYKIMSLGFLFGSITNIISQRFVFNYSILNVNEFSIALALVSATIFIIDKLRIDFARKELLVSIIYSFAMPYITLTFQMYNSITVWAFVFLFYIICIIYNRKIILNTVIVSSLMTQIFVLAISPNVLIEIPFFMLRFIYIGVAAVLASYCNYRYDLNLRKNTSSDAKQSLLLEVMREFIATEELSLDAIIYNFLEKCGTFFNSERAYIVLFDETRGKFRDSFEWKAEGVLSGMKTFENAYSKVSGRFLKQFAKEAIVKLPDTNLLSPTAGELKKMLAEENIRGILAMPIKEKGEVIGILGLNSSRPLKEWNIDSYDFIEIVANVVSDMILKNKAERKNEFFANYDLLTRLPNRVLFTDRLEQAMKLSKRTEKLVAVVLMDVDEFKTINDTLGHSMGDRILVEVAKRLSQINREYDTVSRFGGDEFIIILNQVSHISDVTKIMDKIMRDITKPLKFEGKELFITASAGVALYPQDGEDAETLIKHADTAMYSAKKTGKNRYSFCSRDMKDQGLERLELTNRLYRALEKEQLTVYYQP
ncbi:MAG TPA: sensor domain-containing diguanylate cyclase, partial [Thermoclostridium sp.]|nr:sensor domain-containing diguanylate cyclase [Thermoclostridium sp.]